MGVILNHTPDKWDSAGRPVEAKFISTLNPNQLPGESNLPIFEIKLPTAFELANVPGLDANDVRVDGDWSLANFVAGDWVTITGTQNGFYPDGNYRILKSLSVNIITIEAAYAGDDTFGTLSRYYNNHVLYISCLGDNEAPREQLYPLQKDVNGEFVVNVSEQMARTFPTVFAEVYPSLPYPGTGAKLASVVQGYQLLYGEGYDIPTNGIPEFTFYGAGIKIVSNRYIINSQHPFHETDADGDVLFDWTDDYTDYLVSNNPVSTGAKFLTWGSRDEQTIGEAEDFFLCYLWAGNELDGLELFVSQYDSAGALLGSIALPMTAPADAGAYVINVGTNALGGISPDAAKYSFALRNQNEGLISEVWTLHVRQGCSPKDTRFYWRNSLGGIDQYTFTQRYDETINLTTNTVTKPYVPRLGDFRSQWTERASSTKFKRGAKVWSRPMGWAEHRWLCRELLESADIVTAVSPNYWTPVILENTSGTSFSTKGGSERLSLSYRLGIEQRKQHAA